MSKIKLTKTQNEVVGWMKGSPSFSEYHDENFAWEAGLEEKEWKRYIKEFDEVSHDEDKMTLEFVPYEQVVDEIFYDLERFIDMLDDNRTGYWKENDRAVFAEQQSVRNLIGKIKRYITTNNHNES